MVHLIKLAVGVRDVAHLRAIQAERQRTEPPLRHRTRNAPRRAAELAGGGSLFWVVAGALVVRQRVLEVIADHWEDGTPCAGLLLHPELVAVEGRRMKPFQGWRYLEDAAAPLDVTGTPTPTAHDLPAALRRELEALCLL